MSPSLVALVGLMAVMPPAVEVPAPEGSARAARERAMTLGRALVAFAAPTLS